MVAIIKTGYSIRRTFYYNEHKLDTEIVDKNGVKKPAAELLMAANYPMDMAAMNRQQRLNMLLKLAERNTEVERNSVHISLNFAPGEELSNEKLNAIATEYMQAIGFGDQPFLLYKHNDAGHPHVHIVSVKVDHRGKRIETQNNADASEVIRKDIETRYSLVRAEDHKRGLFRMQPVAAEKVIYARSPTRRAIANVLSVVMDRYHYTTLQELNAILNLYNVHADPGGPGSRTFKNKGLVYRVLDAHGQPVGVPIKASDFQVGRYRPTLTYLQQRYKKSVVARKALKEKVLFTVEKALQMKSSTTFEKFSQNLKRSGISLVQRRNEEGRLYGLTYVDHKERCVFNGSDLDKACSANAIAERFPTQVLREKTIPFSVLEHLHPDHKPSAVDASEPIQNLWELLTEPLPASDFVPYELRPKRKKKKKRTSINPNNT